MVIRVEAVDTAAGTLTLSDGKILRFEDRRVIERFSLGVGDFCALSRETTDGFSVTLYQPNLFKAETRCTACNGHYRAMVVNGVEKRGEESPFGIRRL